MVRRVARRSMIALFGLGLLLSLAAWSGTARQSDERCFPQTNQCISGRIRTFWEQNGGLPVFGYPTTDQHEELVEGKPFQVQWFERNRLELHPENARPYDVLLGRLGAARLEQQGRVWQNFPTSAPRSDCRYFEQTKQNVCGAILAAWRASGLEFDGQSGKSERENVALFGVPISPLQQETTPNGVYQVQWFERARFELHPENQPPFNVLLGLLGNEIQAGNSGTGTTQPPARSATPTATTSPTATPRTPTVTATPTTTPNAADAGVAASVPYFDRAGFSVCDNTSANVSPDQGPDEQDYGTAEIPCIVPIRLGNFQPGDTINVTLTPPGDGEQRDSDITMNEVGAGIANFNILPGDPYGVYRVSVTGPDGSTLVGHFEAKVATQPNALILPSEGDHDTTFTVYVGGVPVATQAKLYLYRQCAENEGCFVRALGAVTADENTTGSLSFTFHPDDPAGSYQAGFFVDPSNFVFWTFKVTS